MATAPHPERFIAAFTKEAQSWGRKVPGVGGTRSSTKVPKGPQVYAQPNPPVTGTNPEMIANQKAVPPPPVM